MSKLLGYAASKRSLHTHNAFMQQSWNTFIHNAQFRVPAQECLRYFLRVLVEFAEKEIDCSVEVPDLDAVQRFSILAYR